MDRDHFNHIKVELVTASPGQILELETLVTRAIAQQVAEIALARRTNAVTEARLCPHCQGTNVVRHGYDQNQRQRLKCHGCKRTYNILTGTPLARARKPEKWAEYLGYMTRHNTVRAIRAAGIGLNHVTIWRWRHRFLQAAANDNAAVLRGVIEADVAWFPYSRKGSRLEPSDTPPKKHTAPSATKASGKPPRSARSVLVLTALDRCGAMIQAMPRSQGGIATALRGRIAAGSVLCTNDRAAYTRVADRARAELRVISDLTNEGYANGDNLVAKPRPITQYLGLGRVHAHHQQLRHLINERCRGVATRYLANYLGWHRAMARSGFDGRQLLQLALG